MTEVSLAQAKGGRARIQSLLGRVQARRPATGADTATRAGWLRDKASVHDQIAGYLRQIGDIPGAVEAEVLATRSRADASDLTRDDGTATTIDGPCPARVRPRTSSTAAGYDRAHVDHYDTAPVQRTDRACRGVDVTSGSGLS